MMDSLPDSEAVLAQFNRLMQEILRGAMNRNTFRPWEVELLLDMEGCEVQDCNRREALKRYQKAVQKQMERGAPLPLKFSEFVKEQRERRERVKAS